jgi:hypothetical protein
MNFWRSVVAGVLGLLGVAAISPTAAQHVSTQRMSEITRVLASDEFQGRESVQRKDGGPDLTLIWTDVWMWRDGKWHIVASQDSVVPEKKWR